MGNAILRERRSSTIVPPPPYPTRYFGKHPDFIPNSRNFTTTDAPWNVTQWIDPLDPYPKVTSIPILLVIRK